jgi:hypothetical protein
VIQNAGSSRGSRAAAWWVGAVIVAAIVISIGTPLFGIRVFHASDVLTLFSPWRDSYPVEVKAVNSQITDTVDGVVPMREELRRRLGDGDFPLWNPYPNGGTPLAAVPDIGSLNPMNLPYLLLPIWYAPAFAKLLEMAVAVGFMFLFLRRLGLGKPASLVGGLIYAFSAFQVVWTNWPQPQVGSMFPALFWAGERYLQERTLRSAVPISVVVAALLFAGFPAIVGYAIIALGVYVVARLLIGERSLRDRARPLLIVGAAIALGIGITAIQLLPFAQQVRRTELKHRESVRGDHLPLRTIVTFAIPDAFGSPVDRVYYGRPNYVEAESFIGATALVLIGVAALGRKGRRSNEPAEDGGEPPTGEHVDQGSPGSDDATGPSTVPGAMSGLWVIAAGAIVLIYVGGPLLSIFQRLPFLGLNSIGRMRSILGLALAALAAIGFEKLVSRGPAWVRARLRGWRTGALALLAIAGVFVAWRAWRFADRAGRGGYALRQAALPAAVAVLAVLVIALGQRWRGRRASVAVWIIPVLVAVECVAFAYPFWPRVPREEFYPQTSVHRFLEAQLGHDRFGAENRTMYAGTSSFYGLRSVTGHTFQEQTWADLLGAVDPDVFHASRRVPLFAAEQYVISSPILDRLAVRFFVTSPEVPIFGDQTEIGSIAGRYELKAGTSTEARLTADRIRGIEVQLLEAPRSLSDDAWLRAEVVDARGDVLAKGEHRIFPSRKPGRLSVAVAGAQTFNVERTRLRLSLVASRGSLVLGAGRVSEVRVAVVKPIDDGLRVAFSGAAVVYERERALPRIRWMPRARVIRASRQRVDAMRLGVSRDEVILSNEAPAGSGKPASIEIVADGGDEIRVRVAAGGDGYLEVADPIQFGWKATIDGVRAEIVAADHAGGAVHVPAGKHVVSLRYVPPGRRTGKALTAVSLLALGAVLVRTRRRGGADSAGA